jgi:hypothetical protein
VIDPAVEKAALGVFAEFETDLRRQALVPWWRFRRIINLAGGPN